MSLHIRHPSVSPADISRELRLEADESFAAGEPRRSRRSAAVDSVHSETYWVAALDPDQWRLAMHAMVGARSLGAMLVMVCGRLASRHREFLSRLRSEGGLLTLRATVSPRALHAFKIPPEVGQWLSDLGMTLEFECLDG